MNHNFIKELGELVDKCICNNTTIEISTNSNTPKEGEK